MIPLAFFFSVAIHSFFEAGESKVINVILSTYYSTISPSSLHATPSDLLYLLYLFYYALFFIQDVPKYFINQEITTTSTTLDIPKLFGKSSPLTQCLAVLIEQVLKYSLTIQKTASFYRIALLKKCYAFISYPTMTQVQVTCSARNFDDETLNHLVVGIMNCEYASAGRSTYFLCTSNMNFEECSKDMSELEWNYWATTKTQATDLCQYYQRVFHVFSNYLLLFLSLQLCQYNGTASSSSSYSTTFLFTTTSTTSITTLVPCLTTII